MAGICAGPGLATEGGLLTLDGPRSQEWPSPAGCTVAANNGLRIDPVTGKLWTPPDPIISDATDTAATLAVVPAAVGTTALGTLEIYQEARLCTRSFWLGEITGGYAGLRAGDGNFWAVQRSITVMVNGAPVAFTGMETVASIENNSGGVIGLGSIPDATTLRLQLSNGDNVRVTAVYQLEVFTFSASAANGLSWRPPAATGILWSYPP